ncbi:hypothetical protein NO559_01675 [Dasania sp. GY-MA-18]|uniref:Uncharacterized protein n=1 Tax=Dasania phycosphaerae TaxID=2950436 RepID=A0A9J6RHS5_9GAMM|nr:MULTISPECIES: hypothetical protein [Dasania]MCR8921461.1 hypothetical protein [Dasania sp. GY-MA-18]MCZ0863889.1 hypothetical protein [Dasania phycosphaerae]MCZ0867617.1 hypothetical protein [Dasania phycosphaerae]
MEIRARREYASMMRECRYRVETLRDFTSGKTHCTYLQTTIESEALQLRKLLELIAFSSLVSYQNAYRTVRSDIAKDWHAARILRKIEDINPEFYPVPVDGFNKQSWTKVQSGYLTRKQFERLYDKCGAMLHSQNPFSKGKSSLAFHKKVPEYLDRIETLLSEHLVELAESQDLIHVIAPMEENAPIQVRYLVRKTRHA